MPSDRPTSITSNQIRKHTLQQDDLNPASLVWQEPIIDKDLTSPPSSGNAEGDRYIVATGASGDWSGQDNDIAQYINSSWSFYTPQEGWFVWVKDEDTLYRFDGSSWDEFSAGEAAEGTFTIGITIDGGGVELTTGYKGFIRIPYACTITKVTLLSDISGNIVIDLWKCTYADFDAGDTHPVDGDSITASAPPTISGATKSEDDTLTAWITSIDAGDIIAFNIDSITDITKVTLILEVTKT